jgi:hypothetical protein
MRQKYGEDWKTNGRVVIGCGAIEPQYRIVSRSEWGSWEGSRIQTPEERRVAISMGLVPETTWIVRKKPTDTANAA